MNINIQFRVHLLGILFCSIFFLGLSTKSAAASEVVSRLYIPTSNQTTILKTHDEQSLLIKDYLGSTRQVSRDDSIDEATYFPYGGDNSSNLDLNKGFTGHRKLDLTGIYHAGARFYSPQLGAFIQADKVEGPNRYMYVMGNPVNYIDPSGNEASSNEILRMERWWLSNPNAFPNRLPIVENSYDLYYPKSENGKNISTYSELYSDPRLYKLAYDYIQRNPHDPLKSPKEFTEFLSKDIYESSPYNSDFKSVWGAQKSNKRQIQREYDLIEKYPFEEGASLNRLSELYKEKGKLSEQVGATWTSYNNSNLYERITQNKAICQDFCFFTGFVMAQAGIPNAVGATTDLNHAFGLVMVGDTARMYDTTWGGDYLPSFYEDREGMNKWQRKYSSWDFDAPWGNNFSFNLTRNKSNNSQVAK